MGDSDLMMDAFNLGYLWGLYPPKKFKVGDVVKYKKGNAQYTITSLQNDTCTLSRFTHSYYNVKLILLEKVNKKEENTMNKIVEQYRNKKETELYEKKELDLDKIERKNTFIKQIEDFKESFNKTLSDKQTPIEIMYGEDDFLTPNEIKQVIKVENEYVESRAKLAILIEKVNTLLDMADNFEQKERILKEYEVL